MKKKLIIGAIVIVVVILIIVLVVNNNNNQSEENDRANELIRQTSNVVMVNDETVEINIPKGGTVSINE